jgi:hypothetical protein
MTEEEIFLLNQKAIEELQKLASPSFGNKPRLLKDSTILEILADPRKVEQIAKDHEISISLVRTIKNGTASYFKKRFDKNLMAERPNDDLMLAPVSTLPPGRPKEISDLDTASILEDPRNVREIALGFNISESSVRYIKSGKIRVPKKKIIKEIDYETKEEVLALFYSQTIPADGNCLHWTGKDIVDGEPRMTIFGRSFDVRRVAWSLSHGEGDLPPNAMKIGPSCGFPPCVSPSHMEKQVTYRPSNRRLKLKSK